MKLYKHFYTNIPGWFTFPNLYKNMVHKFGDNSHFVEVGCRLGQSASYMAVEIINSKFNIQFDCIDLFEGWDTFYDEFINYIEPVSEYINPIKLDSISASKLYEDNSLDFVFIDAGHDYVDVFNDIKYWFPKVKENGIIAGHDYNNYSYPDVRLAVNDFFNDTKIIEDKKEMCWIVNKGYLVDNKSII